MPKIGCPFRVFVLLIKLACVESVSLQFRSKERGTRVKDRAKNGGGGGGKERKETLADKPLASDAGVFRGARISRIYVLSSYVIREKGSE